ncbi:unnamed protein product [Cochlearia groenlandica]
MAEENQSLERISGKVVSFSDSNGYGFIAADDGGDELFVHQSSILSDGFRSLTIGDSVEFVVSQGNDGKTKAVDVTAPGGGPVIKKEISSRGFGGRRGGSGGSCFNCGEVGHMAKDCSEGGDGGRVGERGGTCYNCGDAGHFARDCVKKSSGNVGSGGLRGSSGGGGGGPCYTCGGFGHMARDCASKRQSDGCYECGVAGHMARDCDRRGSGGGGGGRNSGRGGGGNKCFKCGEEGHFARDCSVAS